MLTYPDIDPVLISIGVVKIRWYGLMYVLGFLAAWLLARHRAARDDSVVRPGQVDDLIFYSMLGVIVGGRLGYVFFYGLEYLAADPLYLFKITEGGMSFHGGLLGVGAAMWLYARRLDVRFLALWDFVAPLAPLGLFFGRIGNFINGELWGKPTDMPWGFRVGEQVLHPSMLYEAILEGLVLFVILWTYSRVPRPVMSVTGLFLAGYGLFRFLIEFVRIPDDHLGYLAFGWVTMGQLLSLPMILGGLALIALAYRGSQTGRAAA